MSKKKRCYGFDVSYEETPHIWSHKHDYPIDEIWNTNNPKSVISVMMIIAFIFEQVFCRFEGAMGFHCNREATKQMTKRRFH